jgi:glycosyltransferase involved in cell wall biosynthesis
MRILIACAYQNIVGGVETYLRDLIPALRRRGHAVGLLASAVAVPNGTPICEPDSDLPVWSLNGTDRAEAYRAIEAWKPDVAFLHGMLSPEDEERLVESRATVLFAHSHHGTCMTGVRTHTVPTPCPCRKTSGLSCLLHFYPRRCGGLNPITMTRMYRINKRRRRLLRRYAAVIAASRYMVDEYHQHGVPEERLYHAPLFPTGVTPEPWAPEARKASDRILMMGRLNKEKGGCLLVAAVARLNARIGRPVALVVAGDGPERPKMEALAARLGVSAAFHGWVSPERRTALMRGADILVIPSVTPETFGLIGIEAGCVGLPAVAFAVGGIPDWLRPGKSGELAPGDPPTAIGLCEAMERALADPGRLRNLSVGAWETSREFTPARHLDVVETALGRAANGTGRADPGAGKREG